jgi:hypothetical protein
VTIATLFLLCGGHCHSVYSVTTVKCDYVHELFFVLSRVVDPYSFFPDPDPEFDVGDQYGSRL